MKALTKKKKYNFKESLSSFEGNLLIGGMTSSMVLDLLRRMTEWKLPTVSFPWRLAHLLGIQNQYKTTQALNSNELINLLCGKRIQIYHSEYGIFMIQKTDNEPQLFFIKRPNLYTYTFISSPTTTHAPLNSTQTPIYEAIISARKSDSSLCMHQTFFLNMLLSDIQLLFETHKTLPPQHHLTGAIRNMCLKLIDLCMNSKKMNRSNLQRMDRGLYSNIVTDTQWSRQFNAPEFILQEWHQFTTPALIQSLIQNLQSIARQHNLYFHLFPSESQIATNNTYDILGPAFPFEVVWVQEPISDNVSHPLPSFEYAGRYKYIARDIYPHG